MGKGGQRIEGGEGVKGMDEGMKVELVKWWRGEGEG
jgi:hypothetical protein